MDAPFAYALFKMVIALTGIVVFMGGLYLLLKKKGLPFAGSGKGRLITVVERQYLSPKAYLAHVEWAGKALLIAVTPSGVYVVKEIEATNAHPGTPSEQDR